MERPLCTEYFELISWVTAPLKSNHHFFKATSCYPKEVNKDSVRNRKLISKAFQRMVKVSPLGTSTRPLLIVQGRSHSYHREREKVLCLLQTPSLFRSKIRAELEEYQWIQQIWANEAGKLSEETRGALDSLDSFLKLPHQPGEFAIHYDVISKESSNMVCYPFQVPILLAPLL